MKQQVIYKYPLAMLDRQEILMSSDAEILTAQTQEGKIFIWALVNKTAAIEKVSFEIHGTGNPIPDLQEGERRQWVGTVQIYAMVWHIFKIINI